MQMYVCGLSECDFFVWSRLQSETIHIPKNELFLNNLIPLLDKFCFKFYLKAVMEKTLPWREP